MKIVIVVWESKSLFLRSCSSVEQKYFCMGLLSLKFNQIKGKCSLFVRE